MSSISWRPRLKMFASRDKKVRYYPERKVCYSYNTVVGLVYPNKMLLLTDHNYSRTTNGHYSDLIGFFTRGLQEYTILRVPCTVSYHESVSHYIQQTQAKIKELEESKIRKRASWKIENISDDIACYQKTVRHLQDMLFNEVINEALSVEDFNESTGT
jgi:hypothetical protein